MKLTTFAAQCGYLILLAILLGTGVVAKADTAVLPPDIASFLANERNGVSDEGFGIEAPEGGEGKFVRCVRSHWRYILTNFSSIAPDLSSLLK